MPEASEGIANSQKHSNTLRGCRMAIRSVLAERPSLTASDLHRTAFRRVVAVCLGFQR